MYLVRKALRVHAQQVTMPCETLLPRGLPPRLSLALTPAPKKRRRQRGDGRAENVSQIRGLRDRPVKGIITEGPTHFVVGQGTWLPERETYRRGAKPRGGALSAGGDDVGSCLRTSREQQEQKQEQGLISRMYTLLLTYNNRTEREHTSTSPCTHTHVLTFDDGSAWGRQHDMRTYDMISMIRYDTI